MIKNAEKGNETKKVEKKNNSVYYNVKNIYTQSTCGKNKEK